MMLTQPSPEEKSLAGSTVLVTGAAGFIGSHLTERLLQLGCRVKAMVRYNSSSSVGFLDQVEPQLLNRLEILHGDLRDVGFVRSAVEGCDYVFHLAALIGIPYSYDAPQSYVDVNINGTLNVLQAAREFKVTRLLHTSTSEVYGSAQYTPMDEKHPLHPQSPYAATKVGADQLVLSYYLSFGLPAIVIRPFNTFGPRQSLRAVIPTACTQALTLEKVSLGNLDAERDFTYVEDTCRGFILGAAAKQGLGEVVNLGYGASISVGDMVSMVGKLLGKNLHVAHESIRMRPAKSEVVKLHSNNAKAQQLFGWSPTINLESGLQAVLEWLRSRDHRLATTYVT